MKVYIYNKENKEKKLWEYLPRKQKKRRKKNGRKTQKIVVNTDRNENGNRCKDEIAYSM